MSASVSGSQRDTDVIPVDSNINHYELPNLTQLLYDFTNKEQEIIAKCFRVGNYQSLRDLPNNILSGNLIKAMNEKQDGNFQYRQVPPRVQTLTGGGLFKDYEWMPDSFDIYMKQKSDERKENQRK